MSELPLNIAGANNTEEPDGGVSGSHGIFPPLPLLVSPASAGRGKNTIRLPLDTVACWKLEDVRFDFGSSFVLPATRREFRELTRLIKKHPGAPLAVFGHADAVNTDTFNKRISDHRAESIFGILIRDTARWEKLFQGGGDQEGWGLRSIQHMLTAIGHDAGPPTGQKSPQTAAAVEAFQSKNGLAVDGDPGRKTREKLFAAYMEFLFPGRLASQDFLGGGADAGGKGDLQGCSEFNQLLVHSKKEREELNRPSNKERRNSENSLNRRVVILFFRPGTPFSPAKWPCPRVGESTAACRRRFWSDGESRRNPRDEQRLFENTEDTFACRFYQRLVESSPCEGSLRLRKVGVRVVVVDSRTGLPVPNVALSVRAADGAAVPVVTDETGTVFVEGLSRGLVDVTSPLPKESELEKSFHFVALGRPAVPTVTTASTSGIRERAAAPGLTTLSGDSKSIFALDKPAAGKAKSPEPKAFEAKGLATETVHHIQVALPFVIRLEEENGLPIPEAAFQIQLADGRTETGVLDRTGRAIIEDAPPGPFALQYLDIDDVNAKAMAARARLACEKRDLDGLRAVLICSAEDLKLAESAYETFFNDLSGKGMTEDMQNAFQGTDDERLLTVLMIRAELKTRRQGEHNPFEVEAS